MANFRHRRHCQLPTKLNFPLIISPPAFHWQHAPAGTLCTICAARPPTTNRVATTRYRDSYRVRMRRKDGAATVTALAGRGGASSSRYYDDALAAVAFNVSRCIPGCALTRSRILVLTPGDRRSVGGQGR